MTPTRRSDEHAGDDFSLRTRKRKRKACKFWSFPGLDCVLSGAAISTKPIRVLLSKCFAAEKEARIRSSLRVPLPKRTLLTEFVCAGGHFDQCVGDIEDLLQTDSSPLLKVCSQTQRNMTRNRGMVLKARASVEWRLMQHVKRRTGYFQTVCVVDEGDDVQRQAFWSHLSHKRSCCLNVFEKRLKHSMQQAFDMHKVPQADQLKADTPLGQTLRWSGSTPPLLMISARETDHANLSNKLKAKYWWRQGLLPLCQDQLLERHRTMLPKRVWLKDRRGGRSRHVKQRRLNHHSASLPNMIGDISRLVNRSISKLQKSHERPSRPGGIYHLWRRQQLAIAKAAKPGKWSKLEMDDFDEQALKKWKTLPPDQRDSKRIRSGAAASSSKKQQKTPVASFNVAPLWPIATVDCPCSTFGLSKHMDEVDVGRPESLPLAGLRHLEELSRARMLAEHGSRAPNQLAHAKLGRNDALDPDAEPAKRKAKRDCSTLHFGVCRSDPLLRRPLFSKVAKSLYNACNRGIMGETLYMIIGIGQTICRDGLAARFLWPCWSLSKPQLMLLTEACF